MKAVSIETITDAMVEFGADRSDLERKLQGLLSRYNERHRHHHTFEHIQEKFGELLEHQDEVSDPLVLGFADLYHDAFNDPFAPPGRDEYLSSILAQDELEPVYGWRTAAKVGYFVAATATHKERENESDLNFFLDTDLSVLGSEPERYDRYANNIAREYEDVVPVGVYIPSRISVLQKLSTRSLGLGVYTTEVMREKYEHQAQENIAREISLLQQQVNI